MSELANKALEYHKSGYNCAQAVVCVFCDRLGIEEKELFKVMEAFGSGMGIMGTCGAVSAMMAVIGMTESDGALDAPKTKKQSYQAAKALIERFLEENQSITCRELKGVDTGIVLRSCSGCIQDAVEILEDYLADK